MLCLWALPVVWAAALPLGILVSHLGAGQLFVVFALIFKFVTQISILSCILFLLEPGWVFNRSALPMALISSSHPPPSSCYSAPVSAFPPSSFGLGHLKTVLGWTLLLTAALRCFVCYSEGSAAQGFSLRRCCREADSRDLSLAAAEPPATKSLLSLLSSPAAGCIVPPQHGGTCGVHSSNTAKRCQPAPSPDGWSRSSSALVVPTAAGAVAARRRMLQLSNKWFPSKRCPKTQHYLGTRVFPQPNSLLWLLPHCSPLQGAGCAGVSAKCLALGALRDSSMTPGQFVEGSP